MIKKIIIFLLVTNSCISQNLNSYLYALVPSKFSCQAEKAQYNLNNLTRMILEKNGFETYIDDENFPDDFAKVNCNKVYADLEVKNSAFVTKLKIVLKDCKNNIVFISDEGKSTEKNQSIAYAQALRMASQSLNLTRHQYNPSLKIVVVSDESIVQNVAKTDVKPIALLAKKSDSGFNLIAANSENVYMNLKTTSLKNVFIASRQNSQGIVFKNEEKYYFEFYLNNQKITEPINVVLD